MFAFLTLITLIFLILIQVDFFPFHFAFAAIFSLFLLSKRDFSYYLIFLVAVLFALFANVNIGLSIIAISLAFLLLEIFSKILPDNRLVKSLLVVFSLVLCELSFNLTGKLIG